jgi:hypothetical protein
MVSKRRLTVAASRKNLSPENLTHLHYNLLGKDSRVGRKCPTLSAPGWGWTSPYFVTGHGAESVEAGCGSVAASLTVGRA